MESDALKNGKDYHSKLEDLYKKGWFDIDVNNPKVTAMALAYEKYIYPQFNVKSSEEWFEYKISDDCVLVGRYDGIADDGCVVEHKSTSNDIDEEYIYNLQWDEQILNYMLSSKKNKIYYTVCKKPTIRQKQNESEQEFLQRCVNWYDEDTNKKIRVISVERNEKEINQQETDLRFIADEMQVDCELFSDETMKDFKESIFYRNQSHCFRYGKRCPYSSICLDYNPKLQYVEFTKKENEDGN